MSFTSGRPLERSRWSDVTISAITQFFVALGTFLVMVTLVLAMQRQGARGIEVAALITVEALPMVLLGKLIGRVIDRFDSRKLLIVSGVGQVIACLALSTAGDFTSVIVGAAALSIVSGVAVPTRQALLPAMVVRDDLPRASAIGQTAGSAGMMLGPALAGFMVGGLGPQTTLRLAALGFLATIAGGLLLRTRRGGVPSTAEQAKVMASWNLRGDRLLWTSAWGLTAVIAALSAVNVVLVFFIMRTLGSTEEVYGVIDSMWTVGMLLGAWLFSRAIKPTTSDSTVANLVFVTLGLVSLVCVLTGSVTQALWIVPLYLLGGSQNGGLNVLNGTLMGRRVPAEVRGRASTAVGMRVQAGALCGFVAGGLLLELSEPRWIVIGCGVLGLLAVAIAYPLVARSSEEGTLSHRARVAASPGRAHSIP